MQLAFAAVGSAIGGQVLGTGVVALGMTGGAIGQVIGSLIGSAFAPKQRSYGPRLGDKRVQGSSYGTTIPWVAGTPRLAGEVIWASEIREIPHTEEQGKGGGGASYTSYTYEVDLLIRLTENVVPGMDKAWKFGDLIYNVSIDADPATVTASANTDKWSRITFYSGAADQLPDPDYEAAVGAGNAPATRGGASIFIKDFALGQTNVVPSMSFRLVEAVPSLDLGTELSLGAGYTNEVVVLSAQYALAVANTGGVYAYLIDISGAVPVVVSSTQIFYSSTWIPSLVRVSDTTALMVYKSSGDTRGSMRILSFIGTTIVMGAAVMVPVGNSVANSSLPATISMLDAARYLTLFKDGVSGYVSAFVTTVSGYSVTNVGALYASGAPDGIYGGPVGAALTDSAAIVVGLAIADGSMASIPLAISGDVVTFGALASGLDTNAAPLCAARSDGASALVSYSKLNTVSGLYYTRTMTVSAGGSGGDVQTSNDGYIVANLELMASGKGLAVVNENSIPGIYLVMVSSSGVGLTSPALLVDLNVDSYSESDLSAFRTGSQALLTYSKSGTVYCRIVTAP